MKTKKIVFITPIYLPANLYGSDNYVKVLAEELAKKKFDISIITSNALIPRFWYDPIFGKKINSKLEEINNVKVYRLNSNQFFFLLYFITYKLGSLFLPKSIWEKFQLMSSGPFLKGLYAALKEIQPDVVHCSPSPLHINTQTAQAIKKLSKIPLFIFTPFFHSHVSFFRNSYLQGVFDKADIVHVISQTEKKDIEKLFQVDGKKFFVIPLFLDTRNMHTEKQLRDKIVKFKNTYSLHNKKIILFAGIKGQMKGAIDILLAVNQLYKKDSTYKLIAIGANTKEWDKAKKAINKDCLLDISYKKGIEKEIIFSVCNIFCLPSKSESFGLVYLEAWHKKKPVIAVKLEAVKEFIKKNGFFIEYGNRTQLIKTIELLMKNKKIAEIYGEDGYRKLMKKYTFQRVFPKYLTMFGDN